MNPHTSLTNFFQIGLVIFFSVASEPEPVVRNQTVIAAAGSVSEEEAPVARTRPAIAPASAGDEGTPPIAVECGCEHQAPGGPGQSFGTLVPSSEVGLELGFNASRDQAILSFHSIASGASGDEIYRVEESTGLGTAAWSWSTVWEGSAKEMGAGGRVSLAMSLESASGFFRVVVLTAR